MIRVEVRVSAVRNWGDTQENEAQLVTVDALVPTGADSADLLYGLRETLNALDKPLKEVALP